MLYVVLIGALVIFWLVAVDRPVLTVKFSNGELGEIKGHIPPSFRHNLKDIVERDKATGVLKVYQTRSGMKLKFSSTVAKSCQQHIRNVFPHQGFKAKGNRKSR
ncbi:hypothetical protein VTH8203_03736 [Vibrio thalassae]|uniref:DUF3634 domain-containing protein n=1 Tax=Vibrio thalassae TaxID=1243014 RepID=A0A240EN53_9VIBR|nr:DUF3634 family protein [Vibrio thalassae]SNX50088.1 hypothetical protein VTH8203_03736 [Vibrio thalassae]